MSLHLVTPPASDGGLADHLIDYVRDHLRITFRSEDDDYLWELLYAAIALVDGPTGLIGRALNTQTWRAEFDCFPPIIDVVLPPVQSIAGVVYVDREGVERSFSDYRVFGLGAWMTEIAPAQGSSWPVSCGDPGSVKVTFVAGYGNARGDVPLPICQAIRQIVAHWYEFRSAVDRSGLAEIPLGARALLAPYKVFRR